MNVFRLLCLSILFGIAGSAYAQPFIEWQRPFGGSRTDCAYDIKQTSDGGYITVGHTSSSDGDISSKLYTDGTEYWVVKLGPKGELEWERTYGGSGDDHAYAVQETRDGGYIIAGYSNSIDGDITFHHGIRDDCWIVKINKLGTIEWQRSYGGSKYDAAYDIVQTTDGGFIFVGATASHDGDLSPRTDTLNSDLWIVKIDKNGLVEWQKMYGGSEYEYANSVREIETGGYIIAGITASDNGNIVTQHGYSDGWVLRVAADGTLVWQQTLGAINGDAANSAYPTSDGGFIIAGKWGSTETYLPRGWIVKLSFEGETEWSRMLDSLVYSEYASVFPTEDGSYVVTGYRDVRETDFIVSKFSKTGDLMWAETLGGSITDVAEAICETTDGGFILTGSTFSSDGDVIITPPFHDPDNTSDFWVVKLAGPQCGDELLLNWLRNGIFEPFSILKQTPGPVIYDRFDVDYVVRAAGNLSLRIYNTLGETVAEQFLGERSIGQHHSTINVGHLPSGVYTCHFVINEHVSPRRFIINR